MKFLTAVALALVMLWVPVDGVAQTLIGDWVSGEGRVLFDSRDSRLSFTGRLHANGDEK